MMSALLANGEVWSRIASLRVQENSTEISLPDLDLNNFIYLLVGNVKVLGDATVYSINTVINNDTADANYFRLVSGISNGAAQNVENNGVVGSRVLIQTATSSPDVNYSLFLVITRDADNKIHLSGQRKGTSNNYTTTRALSNFSIETKIAVTVNPVSLKFVSEIANKISAGSELVLLGLKI